MRARAGILLTFSGSFAHRAACRFLILWDLPHFLTGSITVTIVDPLTLEIEWGAVGSSPRIGFGTERAPRGAQAV
jgi:hypothetical protein